MPLECPCGRLIHPGARKCDCGHVFTREDLTKPALPPPPAASGKNPPSLNRKTILISSITFLALSGLALWQPAAAIDLLGYLLEGFGFILRAVVFLKLLLLAVVLILAAFAFCCNTLLKMTGVKDDTDSQDQKTSGAIQPTPPIERLPPK